MGELKVGSRKAKKEMMLILTPTDSAISGSKFEDPVENFAVLREESDGQTDIFVLAADKVILLGRTGTRTEVGRMEGRAFIATKSDQALDNLHLTIKCVVL
jgi:hypothetical protein